MLRGSFSPNPEELRVVRTSLFTAGQPQEVSPPAQAAALAELERLAALPTGALYFLFLFGSQQEEDWLRQTAGLYAKNIMTRWVGVREPLPHLAALFSDAPQDSHDYLAVLQLLMKDAVWKSICREGPEETRRVGAAILNAMIRICLQGSTPSATECWTQLLSLLLECYKDSNTAAALEAAHSALAIVVDDTATGATWDPAAGAFLADQVVPQLVAYIMPLESDEKFTKLRLQYSLALMNTLAERNLFVANGPLGQFFGPWWLAASSVARNLLELRVDWGDELWRGVAVELGKTLAHAVFLQPQVVAPDAEFVLDVLVKLCECNDYDVRFQVFEWFPIALRSSYRPMWHGTVNALVPRLSRIITVLIESAQFSNMDFMSMNLDQDSGECAFEGLAAAPHFYKPRAMSRDTDDPEELSDSSNWGSLWTLRKSAATALDLIASAVGAIVLPVVVPLIDPFLASQSEFTADWKKTEAALLVLGAIANGTLEALQIHKARILAFLCNMTRHPRHLIVCISCWCLGRYARWLVPAGGSEPQDDQWIETCVRAVLPAMNHTNRRISESATSCFSALILSAALSAAFAPLQGLILANLTSAIASAKSPQLLVLFDALGTYGERAYTSGTTPQQVEQLLQTIFDRIADTNTDAGAVVAAFESLIALAASMTMPDDSPFCFNMLKRAVEMLRICECPSNVSTWTGDEGACALDLVSSVIASQRNILTNQDTHTLLLAATDSAVHLCAAPGAEQQTVTLQSGFAFFGDMAQHRFSVIQNYAPQIFQLLAQHIDHPAISVSNNACWTLGILCQQSKNSDLYVLHLEKMLLGIERLLEASNVPRTVVSTAALSIARVGAVNPRVIPQGFISRVLPTWCRTMAGTGNDAEYLEGVQGMAVTLSSNPAAGASAIQAILQVLASGPRQTALPPMVLTMCNKLQLCYPAAWDEALAAAPPALRRVLQDRLVPLQCQ